MPCNNTLPASSVETPARPSLLVIEDLRGRFVAPTQSEDADGLRAEVRRLQNQQISRELRWEGYGTEYDHAFAGVINHATATNQCTARARGEG